MNGYSLALFIHFLSLLLATAAASLLFHAAWRLRAAAHSDTALQALTAIAKVVRAFPIAVIGLLGSGAYMVERSWTWSAPWVVAGLVGLGAIVVLGAGVDGGRARLLRNELASAGLSQRARYLLRDPIAWGARLATVTLIIAIVFVMTMKPGAAGCAAALIIAVAAGALGGLPLARRKK